jgi:hypothetical protein
MYLDGQALPIEANDVLDQLVGRQHELAAIVGRMKLVGLVRLQQRRRVRGRHAVEHDFCEPGGEMPSREAAAPGNEVQLIRMGPGPRAFPGKAGIDAYRQAVTPIQLHVSLDCRGRRHRILDRRYAVLGEPADAPRQAGHDLVPAVGG